VTRALSLLPLSDFVREHPQVQGTGRLVLIDILAIELIALYEVAIFTTESEPSPFPQVDLDHLVYHGAFELAFLPYSHVKPTLAVLEGMSSAAGGDSVSIPT
jgi:hypothetical protein